MTRSIRRRTFLGSGAVAAAGLGWADRAYASGESTAEELRKVQEPARPVPIVESTDVVVCGAGPAGVAAALAAARAGNVRLIENHGQLGGIWTTGDVDHRYRGGITSASRLADRLLDEPTPGVIDGRRW